MTFTAMDFIELQEKFVALLDELDGAYEDLVLHSKPHHLICLDIVSTHRVSVKAVLDLPEIAKTADAARYTEDSQDVRREIKTRGIGWVSLAFGQQVGRPDWEGSRWAGRKKGTPAWEGSCGKGWEIKTPGVAPGRGKRRGVWPAGQERRKANPPGRALAATAGRSRLQALHQAGGKRRGVWPAGQGGRKANPPGRALAATDGRSRLRASHQAEGRDVEFGPPGREGERQTRLGGLLRQLMGDPGITPGGGEKTWGDYFTMRVWWASFMWDWLVLE
ncbi:hypothetical protein ROHU_011126 [Labeo rohita]|uniref:Uncharacterized protein n=1 Tax=Labeo rohita TaxID=84645 RepID=A0A498LVG7_LABRO|nr:hypothetical protein ROHU_011126 [Labeo rohita]